MAKADAAKLNIGSRRGMTLIEIIVGLAVCVIFLAICVAVIAPMTHIDSRTEGKSEAQMIAKNLTESIRGKTDTCTSLTAEDSSGNTVTDTNTDCTVIGYDGKKITVNSDGYLTIAGNPAYPASYYNGKTVTMTVRYVTANKIRMILKVLNSEKTALGTVDTILTPVLTHEDVSSSIGDSSTEKYPGTDIKIGSSYWPVPADYVNKGNYGTITVYPGGVFVWGGEYYVVNAQLNVNKNIAVDGPGGTRGNTSRCATKLSGTILEAWSGERHVNRGDITKYGNDYYVYVTISSYGIYHPSDSRAQNWYKIPN